MRSFDQEDDDCQWLLKLRFSSHLTPSAHCPVLSSFVPSLRFASVETLGSQESTVSTRRRAMENTTTSAKGLAYR